MIPGRPGSSNPTFLIEFQAGINISYQHVPKDVVWTLQIVHPLIQTHEIKHMRTNSTHDIVMSFIIHSTFRIQTHEISKSPRSATTWNHVHPVGIWHGEKWKLQKFEQVDGTTPYLSVLFWPFGGVVPPVCILEQIHLQSSKMYHSHIYKNHPHRPSTYPHVDLGRFRRKTKHEAEQVLRMAPPTIFKDLGKSCGQVVSFQIQSLPNLQWNFIFGYQMDIATNLVFRTEIWCFQAFA